ncbi:MAG TPA: 16S rRNA (cytosine(1402)-N(4))-methyltransferase RsmH, partial [Myxococcaceae bacterium]|nr:16S rRNA (cytosine(1402)-N(4))-methyltransferase RsmH [Myxococcaceae bacterium]
MSFVHHTVLREEVAGLLKAGEGRMFVDGTLGGGGHAEALLAQGATVFGIDRDPRALAAASARLSPYAPRFHPVVGNFADAEALLAGTGALPCDGVVLDLGVSSPQLDDLARGFSFQGDGPLDMRMGEDGPTAAEWIVQADEDEVARALKEFGEEPFARKVARTLKARLPRTTLEAVDAVKASIPRKAWPSKIHVATRTFQGLRIAVNRELESLARVLQSLPRLLKEGGVAAIISFHSL